MHSIDVYIYLGVYLIYICVFIYMYTHLVISYIHFLIQGYKLITGCGETRDYSPSIIRYSPSSNALYTCAR